MATSFSPDNILFPRYICNICGRDDNGFIPSEHSDHERFSLTCDICHAVLHNPRSALHLSGHQPPLVRRVCLTPPPPPPATPASPTPDLSNIQASASVLPETVSTPPLQLTPAEVLQSPASSSSLQPAQHSPQLLPTTTVASPTTIDEVARLHSRLRHVTAHLVGLAAMTAQLPPLTADMPLMAATLAIRAHFTVPSSPASTSFRRLLDTQFSLALPQARTMSTPDIASAMLRCTNTGTTKLIPLNCFFLLFYFIFLLSPFNFNSPLINFVGLFV